MPATTRRRTSRYTDRDRTRMSPSKPSKSSPGGSTGKPSARHATGHPARKTARRSAMPGHGSTNPAEAGDALPLLRRVQPLGPYRVEAVWADGHASEIDLAPHILRYAIYRPPRDDAEALAPMDGTAGGHRPDRLRCG